MQLYMIMPCHVILIDSYPNANDIRTLYGTILLLDNSTYVIFTQSFVHDSMHMCLR